MPTQFIRKVAWIVRKLGHMGVYDSFTFYVDTKTGFRPPSHVEFRRISPDP